jgi:DNA-binding MarR family transcriptional regulator
MVLVVPATSHTAASATDFTSALEDFFRALRRARGRAAQAHSDGLSLAQFQLLDVLGDDRPRTVGQLAEAGGVAQPTATRMLEGLERAGVVERSPAAEDRRCVLVSLTAPGREALAAKRAEVGAVRARLAASLTAAEQRDAAVLLRRLSVLMEDL